MFGFYTDKYSFLMTIIINDFELHFFVDLC